MKKIITILAIFTLFQFQTLADDDHVIQFSQLPAASQAFVQTHFDGV